MSWLWNSMQPAISVTFMCLSTAKESPRTFSWSIFCLILNQVLYWIQAFLSSQSWCMLVSFFSLIILCSWLTLSKFDPYFRSFSLYYSSNSWSTNLIIMSEITSKSTEAAASPLTEYSHQTAGDLQNIQAAYRLNGIGKLSHLVSTGPKPGDPKFDA